MMRALPGIAPGPVLALLRALAGIEATWLRVIGGIVLKALVVAGEEARDRVEATVRLSWPGAVLGYLATGRRLIDEVGDACPDLVFLDLGLPDDDGLEALMTIRRFSSVAVVGIAQSQEGGRSWRQAIELGIDDYVIAPFAPLELLARASAAVRQRESRPNGADPTDPATILDSRVPFPALPSASRGPVAGALGDDYLLLDLADQQTCAGGKPVCLTRTEYQFLGRLALHPNSVVTFRALLAELWGADDRNRLEFPRVFARRIRERIEPVPDAPRYVLTERGIGYRLAGLFPSENPPIAWSHSGDGTGSSNTPARP